VLPSSRVANQYFRTQVESSTPLERVVMLYDAALRALDAAQESMRRNDRIAKRDATSRLLAIVAELQNTLDMERGGTIAAELDRLYDFILTRVMDAITSQQPEPLDEVRRVLVPLGDAWRTLAASPAGMAP
jgi:flagellar secretion chaperone FliS